VRTLSAAQSYVLGLNHRSHHIKVEIDRSGSGDWVDMTSLYGFNWLIGATWNESIDSPVAAATIDLRHKIHQLSLNPLASTSPPNVGGVLCRPYRKLRISTATTAYGQVAASADYNLVFRGRIWKVEWAGPTIKVECRDEGGDLQDLWVEQTRQYGSDTGVALETISQSILTDNSTGVTLWSPNGTGGTPYAVADTPSWTIKPAQPLTEMPILEALNRLWRDQIGWDIRYKWQATAADFKLVASEPTRSGAAVNFTFGADQYTISSLYMSNADVRNAIRGVYYDQRSGDWGHYDASDANSITTYGRKFMQLAEESTSQINTLAEITTLVDNVLADLKEPTAYVEAEVMYFWPAEANDYYTFSANGVHLLSDQSLAVSQITHTFSEKGAKTRLSLSGQPKAGQRWFVRNTHGDFRRKIPAENINPTLARAMRNGVFGVFSNR
jgi:hypothetical protein